MPRKKKILNYKEVNEILQTFHIRKTFISNKLGWSQPIVNMYLNGQRRLPKEKAERLTDFIEPLRKAKEEFKTWSHRTEKREEYRREREEEEKIKNQLKN